MEDYSDASQRGRFESSGRGFESVVSLGVLAPVFEFDSAGACVDAEGRVGGIPDSELFTQERGNLDIYVCGGGGGGEKTEETAMTHVGTVGKHIGSGAMGTVYVFKPEPAFLPDRDSRWVRGSDCQVCRSGIQRMKKKKHCSICGMECCGECAPRREEYERRRICRWCHSALSANLAMKAVRCSLSPQHQRRLDADLCQEARICFALGRHTNITSIHGIVPRRGPGSTTAWSNVDCTLIMMDRVDGGDLKHYIRGATNFCGRIYQDGDPQSVLSRMRGIIVQVARGLHHIHSCAVLHQDCKPDNIGLTSAGVVKILDFGMSEIGDTDDDGELLCEFKGCTPSYASPEVRAIVRELVKDENRHEESRCQLIKAANKLSPRTHDNWSFAIIVLEIFLGGRADPRGRHAASALRGYLRKRKGARGWDERATLAWLDEVEQREEEFLPQAQHHPCHERRSTDLDIQSFGLREKFQAHGMDGPRLLSLSMEDIGELFELRAYVRKLKFRKLVQDPLERYEMPEILRLLLQQMMDDVPGMRPVSLSEFLDRFEPICEPEDVPDGAKDFYSSHPASTQQRTLSNLVRAFAVAGAADHDNQDSLAALLCALEDYDLSDIQIPGIDEDSFVWDLAFGADGPVRHRSSINLSGKSPSPAALRSLARLPRLSAIDVSCNPRIVNVSAFAACASLRRIDVRGCALSLTGDFEGLRGDLGRGRGRLTVAGMQLGSFDPQLVMNLRGSTRAVRCCAVYWEEARTRVLSGSYRALQLFDVDNGDFLESLEYHSSWILCVSAFTCNSSRFALSGGQDHVLVLWDLANHNPVGVLRGHTSSVRCCTVFTDGTRALSGSDDHTLRTWDLTTSTPLSTLEGHSSICCCTVFADGTRALSGGDEGLLSVWELSSGVRLRTIEGHDDQVNCCAVYADGTRALSGGEDEMLKVWSTDIPNIFAI